MASRAAPSPQPRVPLSRDRVLLAAMSLADEGGIGALTMRRLAQALGVEAMTLYYYVDKKDDILDAIVDIVVSEFELPLPGDPWKPAIRRTAISAYEGLVRHPWAASLMLASGTVHLGRLRYMDALLGCLREAGFSAAMTDHAYHALDSHIMGFTLWEVGISAGMASLPGSASAFLAELDIAAYPHLAEHIEQHLRARDPADQGEFAFGLDLILDGLERSIDTV